MNEIITTAEELEPECEPCATRHPELGCADVACAHNCQAWIDEHRPDQPTEPARVLPSREDLSDILRTHNTECTGLGEASCQGCRDRGWMSWHVYRQHVADAILALLADQPTVEQVKAEAVVEFIGRIRPGVNDGSPLAEILDHIAATELSPTQPTPDLFAVMGLPSVEVPSIGGEQHG